MDVVKEEDELETIEEKELAMDEVSLRPKPGVMSKEWTNRLTDYQFLSGKDEVLPKRQTRFSIRSRRNQRASVMVPQVTRKPSDPVSCCPIAIFFYTRMKMLWVIEPLISTVKEMM